MSTPNHTPEARIDRSARWGLLLMACGLLVAGASPASAASYLTRNGAIIDPIPLFILPGGYLVPHSYSGNDLRPGADLIGADLYGAQLSSADLESAWPAPAYWYQRRG